MSAATKQSGQLGRLARGASIAPAALLPAAARAHGNELDWHVPPSDSLAVLLPLLLLMGLYMAGLVRRAGTAGLPGIQAGRSLVFSLGMLLLATALVWPLDAWASRSFAAHMAQHMVLVALAPPLLLAGRPGALLLRGLPRSLHSAVVKPRRWRAVASARPIAASISVTGVLHGVLVWGWHMPAAFDLALRHEAVHWAEHVTLLGSGMLFWRALLRARGAATGRALLAALVTIIHSGMLGALLTLAPHPLYRTYEDRLGKAAALADQQLAGLIMWVPMGTLYLLCAVVLAARLIGPDSVPGPGPAARPMS